MLTPNRPMNHRASLLLSSCILSLACERPPSRAAEPIGVLPMDAIQGVVKDKFGLLKECYATATNENNNLRGHLTVGFAIAPNGEVAGVWNEQSSMPHDVDTCSLAVFSELQFPPPAGGYVTVLYPIEFKKAIYRPGPDFDEQPNEPRFLTNP